jgi:RNA polymerase sigma-70 factor (ECF subfamily)
MNEIADVEGLLRRALAPVDPPEDLATRLRATRRRGPGAAPAPAPRARARTAAARRAGRGAPRRRARLIRSRPSRVSDLLMPLSLRHREPPSAARLRELADEDLMALVRHGEARAFEVIYDRHCDVAFSLAYRICGTRVAAEDVVQESFLSLWRSGARYDRTRGSVRTWVLGIVHNRSIDWLRRSLGHDRHRAGDEGIEERFEAPERTDVEVARRDEAREIRAALDELPDEQSRVIELAFYGGYTHSEIAQMLDTPIGTIKGRMRLGMEKMRHTLEAAGVVVA